MSYIALYRVTGEPFADQYNEVITFNSIAEGEYALEDHMRLGYEFVFRRLVPLDPTTRRQFNKQQKE